MNMNIVRAKNFEISKVKLSEPMVNNYGGKNIYLNYDGSKKPLYFKLPTMKMTFNANVYRDETNKDAIPKHSIVLSFNDMDSNKTMNQCYEKLKKLDEFMINEGVANSKKWFKKKKSKVVIEDNYNSIIRQDEDKKYAPKFGKINIRYRQTEDKNTGEKTGKFLCVFFDETKNILELDDISQLSRGTEITGLIKCNGVYFVGSKFGLSWSLEQAKVKFPMNIREYALDDSDSDDDVPVNTTTTTIVDSDSDDDETEEESDSD